MSIGADGTSHNITNRKGSVGDSHNAASDAHSNFESLDAQGNKKSQNYSKKAASASGSNADFESNLESLKNADGTSMSNSTGNFNNTSYDKATAEEVMSKKNVNADGTSSMEASHAGSNSSKINSASGQSSDLSMVGPNGIKSHSTSNKTDNYALDEANQSAGSISEQIGKNGQRSLNESSIESGRKVSLTEKLTEISKLTISRQKAETTPLPILLTQSMPTELLAHLIVNLQVEHLWMRIIIRLMLFKLQSMSTET